METDSDPTTSLVCLGCLPDVTAVEEVRLAVETDADPTTSLVCPGCLPDVTAVKAVCLPMETDVDPTTSLFAEAVSLTSLLLRRCASQWKQTLILQRHWFAEAFLDVIVGALSLPMETEADFTTSLT